MAIYRMLLLITVECGCGWLLECFYKDDVFLGHQPVVGDIISTITNVTLIQCAGLCVWTVTACQSFFYDPKEQVCALLLTIPTPPSEPKQSASTNVLFSPNRPYKNSPTTTEAMSDMAPSGVPNVSDCLSVFSEFYVDNQYLTLIGPTAISTDEANTTCECLGGQLVNLRNQGKFDYFKGILDTHVSEPAINVILGLRADQYTGPWLWSDGGSYTNIPGFCIYEPNGDQGGVHEERCTVMMYPGDCMDDRNCPIAISPVYFACDIS